MAKIIAVEHVTLDGVVQGPASPDEDRRDGFDQGGWAGTKYDPELQEIVGERMGSSWSLLAGRRTFEHFAKVWPSMPKPNPFTDKLNAVDKFVASRTLSEPLGWENSHLLKGDAGEAVVRLKAEHPKNLVMFGSGQLVQALMQYGLIDQFVLQIHGKVLGKGHRLFDPGAKPTDFSLTSAVGTRSGVVVATYEKL